MVQYNGVPNYYNFSVSKTIYYKKNDPIKVDIILNWDIDLNNGIFNIGYYTKIEGDISSEYLWYTISSIPTHGVEVVYSVNSGSSYNMEDTVSFSAGTITSQTTDRDWTTEIKEADDVKYIHILGEDENTQSITDLIYQSDDIIVYFTEPC